MQRLYELGSRRVLVTGTGPMGCVPAELAQRSRTGECAVELNRAANLFNPQLIQMINQLNSEIGTTIFVAVNAVQMHMDFIHDPQAYGKYIYFQLIFETLNLWTMIYTSTSMLQL